MQITGEMLGKNVTGTIQVFKRKITNPPFYIVKWKWLVVKESVLDCILVEPGEGCQMLKVFCH